MSRYVKTIRFDPHLSGDNDGTVWNSSHMIQPNYKTTTIGIFGEAPGNGHAEGHQHGRFLGL
jgi:hypothetical protein